MKVCKIVKIPICNATTLDNRKNCLYFEEGEKYSCKYLKKVEIDGKHTCSLCSNKRAIMEAAGIEDIE